MSFSLLSIAGWVLCTKRKKIASSWRIERLFSFLIELGDDYKLVTSQLMPPPLRQIKIV